MRSATAKPSGLHEFYARVLHSSSTHQRYRSLNSLLHNTPVHVANAVPPRTLHDLVVDTTDTPTITTTATTTITTKTTTTKTTAAVDTAVDSEAAAPQYLATSTAANTTTSTTTSTTTTTTTTTTDTDIESMSLSHSPQSTNESNHSMITAAAYSPTKPESSSDIVFLIACLATFMAASTRVCFSILAIPIQQQYNLVHSQMGMLQSALLVGYIVGQIPAGLLADRYGGARTLSLGVLLWSFTSFVMAFTPQQHSASTVMNPFLFMLLARGALGLAQSILMPAISAAAAQWFVHGDRGSKTSTIYAFFSIGTVIGTGATPFMASVAGWPYAFAVFGCIGMAGGMLALKYAPLSSKQQQHQHNKHSSSSSSSSRSINDSNSSSSSTDENNTKPRNATTITILTQKVSSESEEQQMKTASNSATGRDTSPNDNKRGIRNIFSIDQTTAANLLLLCWTHSVIGFGFFILQAWIPTFLHSLTNSNHGLSSIGIMSALPWLITAMVAELAGQYARWLQNHQRWPALKIRRCMQVIAHLGGCIALLPLCLVQTLSPVSATCFLVFAVAMQGFCYSGFHSYVADTSPKDAGLVLGLTNSCGILAGIVGNVVAGQLASSSGFTAVFFVASAMYGVSALTWWWCARGHTVILT